MRMEARERVDGTSVTIGQRVHSQGIRRTISRVYSAEYRGLNGKQITESLGTTSRKQARRKAIEIEQHLERGIKRPVETKIQIEELVEQYFESVKSRDVAPKTIWKYNADLDKLKRFCEEHGIKLARLFGEEDLFRYRQWLMDQDYAPKTVQGAVVLAQQVFKWAWRRKILRDYPLVGVSLPKAKARPQPCFTSEQVDQLIVKSKGEEKTAFAMMAYAGLRIGEVEQIRWEDIRSDGGKPMMLHIRRGGSNGTTKDKDDRFIPVHPTIAEHLPSRNGGGTVFKTITERRLLKRIKQLCEQCEFENPKQYKLHSFRHHFASLCANHNVAYRKALAWLGHSSSEMLDLYYHLHDDDSQKAMQALAESKELRLNQEPSKLPVEGSLRASGQSTIEKLSQVPEFIELAESLLKGSERGGFEPPVREMRTLVFETSSLSRSDTSPNEPNHRRVLCLERRWNLVDQQLGVGNRPAVRALRNASNLRHRSKTRFYRHRRESQLSRFQGPFCQNKATIRPNDCKSSPGVSLRLHFPVA